ncbi:MAG: hypothetical protein QM747_07810 [Nocardioides sp.]
MPATIRAVRRRSRRLLFLALATWLSFFGPAAWGQTVPPPTIQTTGPAGAPVPAAWDYVRMTPQQRYELRQRARALPPEERRAHNLALRDAINSLPDWVHSALHNERGVWDCRKGTVVPLPPAAPITDGWAYALLLPTDRHELRLRANALPPEARQTYDVQFAKALEMLPPWLVEALQAEATDLDAKHGRKPCASPRD